MKTRERVPGLIQEQGSSSTADMHQHVLGIDNRRAQNHVLDSILQRPGKDMLKDLALPYDTDEEDIVDVDLRIRKKVDYIRQQMDKAGAAENVILGSTSPRLPSEIISGINCWKTALTKSETEINTWEPPSPAKSSYSRTSRTPGEEVLSSNDAFVSRPDSPQRSEYASQVPATDVEPQRVAICAVSQNNILSTAICAALDTRALVLLWYQGALGPIPGDCKAFPALLTLDQLNTELLSTKLEPKESLSLLYDLNARLGGNSLKDMELDQCCLCEYFKLRLSEPSRALEVLHEFPRWKTQRRCAHKICTTCTVDHMLRAFDDALWMAAGGIKFHCPVPGCEKYLGQMPKSGGPASYAILLPMESQLFMDSCYKMLVKLKRIIKQELPDLSVESRAMGEQTASILRQDGCMMSVSEATKNPRLLQLDGAGTVTSMSASSNSVYKIPVLSKLLKRDTRPRRCVCCHRNIHEVEIQNPRLWRKTMSRCIGQGPQSPITWGLQLMSFPLEFNGGCADHAFVCIECLRVSIGSDKEFIKKVPVQVSCPSWDCHCVLNHGEIRACLEPSVREAYDWVYTHSELVATPGFVWCSKTGCARGQVYEGSEPVPCQSCGRSLQCGSPSEQRGTHRPGFSFLPRG